jgi:hypothetical protein
MEQAFAILEKRIQKHREPFTLNEAAAATGLSIDESRDALEKVIKKYVCRLQVTENGDLIYNFGETLRRWDEKTLKERLGVVLEWLWKAFVVIFKAWITVTLVVYFVVFLVCLVALLMASRGRRDARGTQRSSVGLERFLPLFFSIFRWRTVTRGVDFKRDREGYRYRHYQSSPGVLNPNKKSFVASVYDFVFGPPRVAIDPLSNEKEVADYLRGNRGVITASELIRLAGWSFAKAETFMTECCVRFQGDVDVSENGVVYCKFDQVLRTLGDVEAGTIVYYWDEYEPEYEWTGNSPAHNFAAIAMNSFNLVFSLLVIQGVLFTLGGELGGLLATHRPAASILLGWIPFVFSVFFFLVPALRFLKIQTARKRRRFANIRKRLMKAVFKEKGRPQTVEQILAAANATDQEEKLTASSVDGEMKELVLDLEGESTATDRGELKCAFPRITLELEEVSRLRAERTVDSALGGVILDSD